MEKAPPGAEKKPRPPPRGVFLGVAEGFSSSPGGFWGAGGGGGGSAGGLRGASLGFAGGMGALRPPRQASRRPDRRPEARQVPSSEKRLIFLGFPPHPQRRRAAPEPVELHRKVMLLLLNSRFILFYAGAFKLNLLSFFFPPWRKRKVEKLTGAGRCQEAPRSVDGPRAVTSPPCFGGDVTLP